MEKRVFVLTLCIAVICCVFLIACGNNGKVNNTSATNGKGSTTSNINTKKALNVSIYLDLSDRLERNMTPNQSERDIEIVQYLAEIVKNHAVSQKILPSTDRIKVFFYPSPNDSKINLLSQDLELDLGKAQPAEKKKLLNI